MLSRELMGALALAIVWVNTLLLIADAYQRLALIAARLRRMRPPYTHGEALIEARVVRGDGRGDALAGHRVEQVGRAGPDNGGREGIVFSDRTHGGEIHGGLVAAGDRPIAIAAAVQGEVWVAQAEVDEAAACPSEARFNEAYPLARRARGFSRTVEARIRAGTQVWLLGVVEPPADEQAPARMTPTLVSTVDPRAWCRARIARLAALGIGAFVVLMGCTALVLVPPHFGPVSTAGGALCLVFFLQVQMISTTIRDAARPPSRAFVRGQWIRERALDCPEHRPTPPSPRLS